MTEIKRAQPDYPIDDLIAERWSPYVFDSRPVAVHDLKALFEAARWAPSSYNEQPWRYIVGHPRACRTVRASALLSGGGESGVGQTRTGPSPRGGESFVRSQRQTQQFRAT